MQLNNVYIFVYNTQVHRYIINTYIFLITSKLFENELSKHDKAYRAEKKDCSLNEIK